MYLYLIVLIRTSLGFLWSFISLKDWAHWVSKHWRHCEVTRKGIAVRQDSCHPCIRSMKKQRSFALLWQCLSVFGPGLWSLALCFVLCLACRPHFPVHLSQSPSTLSLPLTDFGKQSFLALWLQSRDDFPHFLVLSYLFSMHNWNACGFSGWLKSLVGMVEI